LRAVVFNVGKVDLPSGMRIFLEEDRSQPLVAVVAVVDVGSAQDPPGKEGLAHLVEHLTFRARPDGKVQRSNLLDFAGVGRWNAFTTQDLTTYVSIGPRSISRRARIRSGAWSGCSTRRPSSGSRPPRRI